MSLFTPVRSKFQDYEDGLRKAIEKNPQAIRSQQQLAVEKLQVWFQKQKKRAAQNRLNQPAMVVMPTGTGKSGVIVLAPYLLANTLQVKNVLIITPSAEISKQLKTAFTGAEDGGLQKCFFSKVGLINDTRDLKVVCPSTNIIDSTKSTNDTQLTNDITITNAHKFTTGGVWKDTLPKDSYQLVIVDEAHHLPSETWRSITDHFGYEKTIFFTATPYRSDNKAIEFKAIFQTVTYQLHRNEAVAAGIIRDVELVSHNNKPEINLTDNHPWDEKRDFILERVYSGIILSVQETLEHNEKNFPYHPKKQVNVIADSHKAMAYVNEISQADKITALANKITKDPNFARAYHGRSMQNTKAAFESNKVKMLVVCGKLLEGYDHPPISVVAVMSNIVSGVRFSQFVGRAIRKHTETGVLMAKVITDDSFTAQTGNFHKYVHDTFAIVERDE